MAKDQKEEIVAKWQMLSADLEKARASATQSNGDVSKVALLEANISSLQVRLEQAQQEAIHQTNALQHAQEELKKAKVQSHQSLQVSLSRFTTTTQRRSQN